MPITRSAMAEILHAAGAFKPGRFLLREHRTAHPRMEPSPYLIDLRTRDIGGPLEHSMAVWIGKQAGFYLWPRIILEHPGVNFTVGIPRAGGPLAEGFFLAYPNPPKMHLVGMIKEHGSKESPIAPRIVGQREAGWKGLIVDDVISGGRSMKDVYSIFPSYQLTASACAVIVDRQSGGTEEMARLGIDLYCYFRIDELARAYVEKGIITTSQEREILAYGPYMREYIATHEPVA